MSRELRCLDGGRFWGRVDLVVEHSGLTKAEICKRMGVSRKMLYHDPFDVRSPSAAVIAEFCRVTKVSANWLLGINSAMDDELIDKLNELRADLTESEEDKLKLEGALELVRRFNEVC